MNHMKKITFTLASCIILLSTSIAQEKSSSENKHHKKSNRQEMRKNLNLSQDQKEKIKSIQHEYKEKSKTLKSDDNMTRGDFKKQMKSLNDKRKAEVDATLTAVQKNQIKAERENKKNEMKQKSAERFNKMSEKLGLDEKQKASIQSNQIKTQSEIKAIRDNKDLSESQKKDLISDLRTIQKESTKSILSAEQQAKLNHHNKK